MGGFDPNQWLPGQIRPIARNENEGPLQLLTPVPFDAPNRHFCAGGVF
jgi:hypothetical protein